MYKNILSDISVPFEEISIPSKGLFYSNNQNSFMVKYLTSKEETVLTSPTLSESGKAMEIVLSSCILDWSGDFKDILVGDKNAILLYLRSTSYGDDFKFNYICSSCKKETEGSVRLSSLESKEIDDLPNESGEYIFELPKMKIKNPNNNKLENVVINFKPKTIGDEIKIKELENEDNITIGEHLIKSTTQATYRVLINSINGIKDDNFIKNVLKKMSLPDSSSLKEYMNKVEPGINTEFKSICQNCGNESKNRFPIDVNLFGYPDNYRESLMDEVFLVSYYSKGSITRSDAINMSVLERRWAMQKINEEVEKKNKAEKAAMTKAKNNSKH